jgi:hypothetical protein
MVAEHATANITEETAIFCVALTAQIFTQDIHAKQYLMSLELGKLVYFGF